MDKNIQTMSNKVDRNDGIPNLKISSGGSDNLSHQKDVKKLAALE